MNKFYGLVGFEEGTSETSQDVYDTVITWRPFYGDIIRSRKHYNPSEKVNDDVNISNSISIMSNSYAYNHLESIRYVKWMGSIWKVTDIEVQYPRLILTMGGLCNVEDPERGTGEEASPDSGE